MKSAQLFAKFFRQIRELNWTLANITTAFNGGRLVRRDLSYVYQGVFLQSVVSFELLIESLLLGLVTGQVSHPRPTRPVIRFQDIPKARRIITRGRYEDWLPYGKLKQISGVYFLDGSNPFDGCPPAHINETQKACHIRNYIAHKSTHAEKVFRNDVVFPTVLPLGQRDLLGYFMFPHSYSANKLEYHVGELVNAARWFCGL